MVTQPKKNAEPEWVLLSYRVPREPSTPRIAIWRRLRKLGVAQVGDGLVALPYDARTKEHLEWVAAKVVEASGEAIVWVASIASKRQHRELAAKMNDERDVEYGGLIDEIAELSDEADARTTARLRREWNRIERRDYFRSPRREEARLAIRALADANAEAIGKSVGAAEVIATTSADTTEATR